MKIIACTIYCSFTILYLLLGDSSRTWGGFNMLTQFVLIASFAQTMKAPKKVSRLERLFLNYTIFLTLTLSAYTIPCIWAYGDWVKYCTFFYAAFMGLIFVCVVCYGYYKYSDELGKR
jgi:hypothetical protein